MIAALQLTDIAVRFGGVQAVDGVSLVIEAGQFVGLIGPNGAGKTTLIRIVAGALRADRGRVLLGGTDITDMRTASRIRKGMALTHQMVRPFREMTALDNVALAAGYLRTSSPLRAILHVRQIASANAPPILWCRSAWAGSAASSRAPCRLVR